MRWMGKKLNEALHKLTECIEEGPVQENLIPKKIQTKTKKNAQTTKKTTKYKITSQVAGCALDNDF